MFIRTHSYTTHTQVSYLNNFRFLVKIMKTLPYQELSSENFAYKVKTLFFYM
jgi:hypothetical protein